MQPSARTLDRLPKTLSARWEAKCEGREAALRSRETVSVEVSCWSSLGRLLYAGEHFLRMRTRVDLRKDVGDAAVLINDISDTARKTGAPSPIRFTQDMGRIAEEGEAEAGTVGKGFIVFDRIKTGPENLDVAPRKGVIESEEPAPFGGSPPGVGFGIKPQDHLFAAEIGQVYGRAIVRRHSKIRCL
jgi:hypothetical protein